MNFGQLASKMTPKGWAMVGGAAAAAIVFLVLIMNFASKPSYSTLMTGLDPTQTGKITSTLSTKGIGYQIQNNGTAIAVQSDKTGEARIALATAGLLNGTSQPGFELFDKQQLGASNFQQQITYQRALEGQLDQTIEGIQGVSSAQVQLVLPNPQDQLFSDSTQSSSAAVLLSNSATLDPNSVKGIAQLVASSVPGLQLNKVTITDSSGTPLWPNSDGSGADGTTLSQQAANQKYDSLTEAQVGAMLTQTLGPNKAEVQVNGTVDANQATSDTLTYGKKGVALQTQTQNESLKGAGGTGGVAGTAGNIPAAAQTGASSGSNYKNKTDNTTFGVDKTVTHAVIAPGAVKSQTVSVLVDKSVPASSLAAHQVSGRRRRRPQRQARRHDLDLPDRVRQADHHDARGDSQQDARLRQVRPRRPRRPDLPVLHDPHDQAPRARVLRAADLAARARDPAFAGGAERRRRHAGPRRARQRPPAPGGAAG